MAKSTQRSCRTCGDPVVGQGRRTYCQDSCNPRNQRLRCPGCGEPVHGQGQRYCGNLECRPRCIEVGCDEPLSAKGLCVIHYHRRLNLETVRPPRQCESCGAEFPSRRGGPRWCSEDCKPRCIEAGCDLPRRTKGRCSYHYASGGPRRCLTCSSPVQGKLKYCSPDCYPQCTVTWCSERGRIAGLCWRHDSQRRNIGELRTEFSCGICGDEIAPVNQNGLAIKANTRLCSPCRAGYRASSGISITALILRDGLDCSLCFQPIDTSLTWPNPGSISIDHIRPRSLGGSNDPSNLALSHLGCNCSKGNRVD